MRTLTLLIGPLLMGVSACKGPSEPVDSSTPVDSVPNEVDADGDGYTAEEDCDDSDAGINPGSTEVCDGLDNNCDGEADEGLLGTYYRDADGDGYGVADDSVEACEAPEGYVDQAEDCEDNDPAFYPGAPETDCADPNDYNCDGSVAYEDNDGDGFAACEECDDSDPAISPAAEEICDEVDQDCDTQVDEGVQLSFYADADGDGYGDAAVQTDACELPSGYVTDATDCDDAEATTSPGADELCDGVDNDCDGDTDEDDAIDAATWFADADADGYGDPSASSQACDQPSGAVSDSSDCDDTSASTFPGADEYCDGVDNDCDGTADEDDALDASTWYADADADTYGDPSVTSLACNQPSGSVADSSDCDDSLANVYPGATESCDGDDEDCDLSVDEGLLGQGQACPAESCVEVLADQPSAADGAYWLDPTASGTAEEYQCDMVTDGGGWTQVLYWDRETDGDGLTEWGDLFTENTNNMGTWQEQTGYLQWCDGDFGADVLDYELDVEVPNGGELLWDLKEEGRDYFYQSAFWFSAETTAGTEEVACSDNTDDPTLWTTAEWAYTPSYACSLSDLDWAWDYIDEQSTLSAEVTGLRVTSVHHDTNCGDESRLYRVVTWVR